MPDGAAACLVHRIRGCTICFADKFGSPTVGGDNLHGSTSPAGWSVIEVEVSFPRVIAMLTDRIDGLEALLDPDNPQSVAVVANAICSREGFTSRPDHNVQAHWVCRARARDAIGALAAQAAVR